MKRLLPLAVIFLAGCGIIQPLEFDNFVNPENFTSDPNFAEKIEIRSASLSGEKIFENIPIVHIEVVGKTVTGVYWKKEHVSMQLSGAVIDFANKAHILTAGHINPKDFKIHKIFIYFPGSRKPPEEAELAITDNSAHMDFALLRFKNPDFHYEGKFAVFSRSADLKHGEKVYALGSPLGTPFSISDGVVMNNGFSQYIYFSALSNPGNSGGPLVNERGGIVGIVIAGKRGNALNPFITTMPVALPIDDIVTVLRRLKKGGETRHPDLPFGVIDSAEMSSFDFEKHDIKRPDLEGVMVLESGNELEVGDVVLECDGMKITDDWQLVKKLTLEYDSGDKAMLKIYRYGKTLEIEVELQ